jgi:hypothetical protein
MVKIKQNILGPRIFYLTPVPIKQAVSWSSQRIWTLWRREEYIVPNGIRTPGCTTDSLLSISTATFWLPSLQSEQI